MSIHDHGGPAFPVQEFDQISGQMVDQNLGMSLRDYFAGKALAGFIAARLPDHSGQDGEAFLAADAYIVADAMLKAREA